METNDVSSVSSSSRRDVTFETSQTPTPDIRVSYYLFFYPFPSTGPYDPLPYRVEDCLRVRSTDFPRRLGITQLTTSVLPMTVDLSLLPIHDHTLTLRLSHPHLPPVNSPPYMVIIRSI